MRADHPSGQRRKQRQIDDEAQHAKEGDHGRHAAEGFQRDRYPGNADAEESHAECESSSAASRGLASRCHSQNRTATLASGNSAR